jgi:hypothetical protein
MDMSVSVPSHLLVDIFRLLDYLGGLSDQDDLFSHKSGYIPRFEHDNALWELKLKIKQLQLQILETYLLTVGDIDESERHGLEEWFAGGNSVYDNPYSLYDESGCPMDYINGCRIGMQIDEGPSRFFRGGPDDAGYDGCDEDPPF